MISRRFSQVDVFSSEPFKGNPVAVVLDADGMDSAQMQQLANWTNLSETTFVFAPQHPEADYRLRIFSTSAEYPFAGHPTLGSARAWLDAGGTPKQTGRLVQECGAGLVEIRHDGGRLAFKAPPMSRFGPLSEAERTQLARGLSLAPERLLEASWLVNGPEWIGVRLQSAAEVLALVPDFEALGELKVGVIGACPEGSAEQFEVRTFMAKDAVREDPVTGSFNAGAAQWLIGAGLAPESYIARQGTVLGRAGRIHVELLDGEVWIGGAATCCVSGAVLTGSGRTAAQ